ncbi:heme lyase CcmF/NrfE family subunit [Vibrio viridaestus]|uniref:Heme lyase CcmF/NrfE family subunit n=1 Tax=Vibrio viridaestus TaxID=2487322 RepID=A0A3N9TIM4_9VIBR|nr:heme lyase CcmF/NrfE family subunit [Vibrio viridaestus]RQW64168.1 heme lyase CcmF/NrfE family subunit [Vibrio viridaestus]
MIIELGHFSVTLALALAMLLFVLPLWGAQTGSYRLVATAKPLTIGVFIFILLGFASLLWAFYTNDFTVTYVASNSNSHLPWYYRLTAIWGGHEGSLMLWVLIQSVWALGVAVFSRKMPIESVGRVLAILGAVMAGFLLFILLTSNPFLRTLPIFPVDGRDLNPLLQDPGLIIHPPMLYMGYVGFSVAFAFAIASLISGQLDSAWARWSRPWTAAAWLFLTFGITLGSWWAYYELGWGGWWFWDPVENASLMPWLSGTALLHSLAVTEKRSTFKVWTVLLAITTFSLSLLGTFLVRSGVLVSVHAFASDPKRGLFILIFLAVVIGSSLLLYAFRASSIRSKTRYELISRENSLLLNNVVLMAALVVVFTGTLLPLVHKQLGLGSISIGAPFFNMLFMWLAIPFAVVLGVAPLIKWRRDNLKAYWKPIITTAVLSAVLLVLCLQLSDLSFVWYAQLGWWLALWIVGLHAYETYLRATYRERPLLAGLRALSKSHWAMVLAHIGFAVTLIGISMVQNYSVEKDVRLEPGQHYNVAGYDFLFKGVRNGIGPNYQAFIGEFEVKRDGKLISYLSPEKRYYPVARSMMTETAIDKGIFRDLYVAMGEQLDNSDAWAVRVYYKPFIRWIWFGGLLMVFGGILSISDKRYRFFNKVLAK